MINLQFNKFALDVYIRWYSIHVDVVTVRHKDIGCHKEKREERHMAWGCHLKLNIKWKFLIKDDIPICFVFSTGCVSIN